MIFAHAKSIINKAKRNALKNATQQQTLGCGTYDEIFERTYNLELKCALSNFNDVLDFSTELHNLYINKMKSQTKTFYFITIKPNDSQCSFLEFKNKLDIFLQRSMFLEYTYSLEQNGLTPSDLGKGFHVHIVTNTSCRSKAEVLRNCLSSWNDWIKHGKIASNCIEVISTKNPDFIIKNYMVEYKSEDNHKLKTKEWDDIWRNENNLQKLYCYPGEHIPTYLDELTCHGLDAST